MSFQIPPTWQFWLRWPLQTSTTNKLEGRVVGKKKPVRLRPAAKQHCELLLQGSSTATSASTSTTQSPPPEASYAALTNVSLIDAVEQDEDIDEQEYKQIYQLQTKYIIVDSNGKTDVQNTLNTGKQSPSNTYKETSVHYICLQTATECPKSDEQMEPNSAPPYAPPNSNPPHYNQIPAYEYDASHSHYEHVYEQPGAPSYYVTTGYSAEYSVGRETHYVLEPQPPGSYTYPNGYPSTSNSYQQIAYPPHGAQPGIVYSTTAPPYDQRAQPIGQRQFVDVKGYPVSRNVVQIVDVSRPSAVPISQNDPNAAKPVKKRSIPVPTHTITSVPIDAENKSADNKKLFKCIDCGKSVSSARNLNRHRESCKIKKQKAGEDPAASNKSSSSSLGSPPKQKSATKQPAPLPLPISAIPEHPGQQPQSYQTYVPAEGVIYQGHPPHYTHYPPHTALPHSNSQPAFEYPSNIHSAPPTMSTFQPPLTPLQSYVPAPNNSQNPAYDAQRPMDYNGEPMGSQVYTYTAPMDSFIENAIDEMSQNPLPFLGAADYESNSSADRSLHDSSDFSMHAMHNGPPSKSTQLPPDSAGTSSQQKGKGEKKTGERKKNSVPTPHRCNACQKYMCSQRSLRRHKSTCKLYLKTTPELTPEEKQLIAKNEENKCDNCEKVFQSPSNLRRHKNGCKQKSEDESKPPLSAPLQANNSPTRNPTIVEHLTSQVASVVDPNAKRLMPPPEAQDPAFNGGQIGNQEDSNGPPTTIVYIKSEDTLAYENAGPSTTVGEHLRHGYTKPTTVSSLSKPPIRRPPILGRKSSLQNVEVNTHFDSTMIEPPATCPPGQTSSPIPNEFHSRSAPPIDIASNAIIKQEFKVDSEEAMRKSKQVAGVIDSVVERIRRQNDNENGPQAEKRPSSLSGSTPPAKIQKVEQGMRPLTSIITTQPLPASSSVNHLQLSPRYNTGPIQQQPAMIQQRSMSMPQPGFNSSQIQIPLVTAAEQESTEESKIVARYMCPECLKFYACRKNIIKHRIETHGITEQEAETNAAKRVKVRSDTGFILNAGFDRENAILKERSSTESVKPTVVKMSGQPKKRNSTASNGGDNKAKKSPMKPNGQQQHSIDQVSPQSTSTHFYMPNNSNGMHIISPQYEQMQPVPMNQYGPPQTAHPVHPYAPQQVGYNPNFMASDHLEIWDQIKSRVDVPFLPPRRDNAMDVDVAKIAADLKAEFEVQQQQSPAHKMSNTNGGDFHSALLTNTDSNNADPMLGEGSIHSALNDTIESEQSKHSMEDGLENGQSLDLPSFSSDLGALDGDTVVKT